MPIGRRLAIYNLAAKKPRRARDPLPVHDTEEDRKNNSAVFTIPPGGMSQGGTNFVPLIFFGRGASAKPGNGAAWENLQFPLR